MKLDKLRAISEELETEFQSTVTACVVYYFFEDKWNKLDDPEDVPDEVAQCLGKSQAEPVAYHIPSSRNSWFACPAMSCSIAMEFSTAPKAKTRKIIRGRLEQVLTRASNAYQVAHHPLTLLLSKDAFGQRLQDAIKKFNDNSPKSANTEGSVQQELLAVFAFDIDHFKQVNDSHGHLYGDQVLKTFAKRLESASELWQKGDGTVVEVALAHPSGEEFLAMLRGPVTRDQLVEFGDLLRSKVGDDLMPSDEEWAWLQNHDNISGLVPPPLDERKVTTSIGMALYAPAGSAVSARDRVSELLDQADTALYRAKAGGRNQLIAFDEILLNCGRILEHDVGTRIIAIDIGKNVGVALGQEFLVYPPGFNGKRKFEINDGRSRRTIGMYPRFSLTRITVFNVQPELSFAFISESNETALTLEIGSQLEAVPLGSIGHLLPHAVRYLSQNMQGVKVGDIDAVTKYVDDNQRGPTKPYAVVFRYTKADQYLKRYGVAALNAALARLYRDAVATFHVAGSIGILDSTSVVMVGNGNNYAGTEISQFVEKLRSELTELGLVAGVFHTKGVPPAEVKRERIDPSHAIEFARFAASDHAIEPHNLVTRFNYATAHRILTSQREATLYASGHADFEKLRSLGIKDAYLVNMSALMWSAQRRYNQAADLFDEAAALSPSDSVYKTNFVTVAFTPDRMERALRLMAALDDERILAIKDSHAFGFFSYTRILATAYLDNWPDSNEVRLRWMAPIALTLFGANHPETTKLIQKAIAKLDAD